MLRNVMLAAVTVLLIANPVLAQNLIVNGDFESYPPWLFGNNIGHQVTPWAVTPSGQANVVEVDGPGGQDYGASGPESDASAPGAGIPQHYLDINGDGTAWQAFKPLCRGDVRFGASFSTRDNMAGKAEMGLWLGSGMVGSPIPGTLVSISLPAGQSKTDSWKAFGFTAPVMANVTYTLGFKMDNTVNLDNVFARHVVACGTLKICKVAGLGVPVGTPFQFTTSVSASPFTVPAGPAPGGTCVIGPSAAAGTHVTVSEVIPPHHVVSNIDVVPANQVTANLATGSVDFAMGPGVTEVTFTDKRTGFLEICKRGDLIGNFTFSVKPGALGPIVVAAGACSPAIEVPAGTVTIHEILPPPPHGVVMSGCSTIPPSQQGTCDLNNHTSTVTVAPGGVAAQTIAIIENMPVLPK